MFEEPNQRIAFIKLILATVVEPDSPDCDQGFAILLQIGPVVGVPADLHSVNKSFPIVDDGLDLPLLQSRQVIHDGIRPAVPIGSLATMCQHRVAMVEPVRMMGFNSKSLHE